MGKAVEIPYGYGDVIAITGTGTKVVVWLKDSNSMVRGLLLDITDPGAPVLGKDEVVLRRKTEGQVRRKKLPPVGASFVEIDTPPAAKAPVPSLRPLNLPSAAPKPAAPRPPSARPPT